MPGQSTASRSKQYMEKQGFKVGKTEMALFRFEKFKDPTTGKQDSRAKFLNRRDLFGFIDMVALSKTEIIAVQACGETDIAPHQDTITGSEAVEWWIRAGGRIELHAWRKLRRGTKAWRWVPRIFDVNVVYEPDGSRVTCFNERYPVEP